MDVPLRLAKVLLFVTVAYMSCPELTGYVVPLVLLLVCALLVTLVGLLRTELLSYFQLN